MGLSRDGGDFNATGVSTLTPGSVTSLPTRTVIASRAIPAGCKALLQKWSGRVIDIGNDNQIYFAIQRNGIAIAAGFERIPGEQFTYTPQLDLNIVIASGLIEIVAYNISGVPVTIEPNALAARNILCTAWWSGTLISERG
jgi:hypothetical protein